MNETPIEPDDGTVVVVFYGIPGRSEYTIYLRDDARAVSVCPDSRWFPGIGVSDRWDDLTLHGDHIYVLSEELR